MRKLAERTQKATGEISITIQNLQQQSSGIYENSTAVSNIANKATDTMSNFLDVMNNFTNEMSQTSKISNKSSFALFLSNYKLHHILFKSNAYSAVVNSTVTEELKSDYKHCGFGKWYYSTGMKLFAGNATFKEMESHHMAFHNLINESIECALGTGCMAYESKEKIMNKFQDAEEHSNRLFDLMNRLSDEVGDEIEMSEVMAIS